MSKVIEEIQNNIVEDFEDFFDWEEKYTYLIEQGMAIPPLAEEHKIKDNLVIGCQSQVWLLPEYHSENNKITYQADSDALIVKGLISLLLKIFNNQSPQDILASELFIFEKIGLKGHLSPSRANGLSAMIRDIKAHASKYQ